MASIDRGEKQKQYVGSCDESVASTSGLESATHDATSNCMILPALDFSVFVEHFLHCSLQLWMNETVQSGSGVYITPPFIRT